MAYSTVGQRVAIAGTVTNAATEEAIPQTLVRITQAPPAFAATLMAFIQAELCERPDLKASYEHLFGRRSITADTLKTAQIILDTLERNHWLTNPRQDQTVTGGDGHYCFFDLAPGHYSITATFSAPNYCYGSTQGQAQVPKSNLRLAFSELDLVISLVPIQLAIPAQMATMSLGPQAPTLARAQLLLTR